MGWRVMSSRQSIFARASADGGISGTGPALPRPALQLCARLYRAAFWLLPAQVMGSIGADARSGGSGGVLSDNLWLGADDAEAVTTALKPKLDKTRIAVEGVLYEVLKLEVRAVVGQAAPRPCHGAGFAAVFRQQTWYATKHTTTAHRACSWQAACVDGVAPCHRSARHAL